jgi:hypothetical protein
MERDREFEVAVDQVFVQVTQAVDARLYGIQCNALHFYGLRLHRGLSLVEGCGLLDLGHLAGRAGPARRLSGFGRDIGRGGVAAGDLQGCEPILTVREDDLVQGGILADYGKRPEHQALRAALRHRWVGGPDLVGG